MTKLQNVGGYGILAIPTLPAIIVFFHAIRGNLRGCTCLKCTNRANSILPQNSQISQNLLAVAFSHRIHRTHRTFLP